MIVIDSQKLTIPEEERFVGFFGDDRYTTKNFLVKSVCEEDIVYTLYLTFDNGKTTDIMLDSIVQSGQTTLTWSVQDNHILKSGLIKAQIKVKKSDGEIFYTESDYFYAGKSLPFEGDISDSGYADIYDLEEKISEIIKEQFKSIYDDFVPKTRKVAGLSLDADISAIGLCNNLRMYPMIIGNEIPTSGISNVSVNQLYWSRDEGRLFRCSYKDASVTHWEEIFVAPKKRIAGLSLQTDITVEQLQTALGIGDIETALDSIIEMQNSFIGGTTV